ncbi:hypothetical protein HPP92_006851 [Vanilla planifolia]|uniref:Uncharacterized protein n=1 Tax=Vanilla planifolia TaxID=51239 RepID=A0A835RH33_VANPL|nr:hypothetical protein HPP92_006851 [Vanilla planifolia]
MKEAMKSPSPVSAFPSRRIRSFSYASPLRTLPSTAVPFSWEREPGIPKNPRNPNFDPNPERIPLPPPIRCASFDSRKKWKDQKDFDDDPFALALAECAKGYSSGDQECEELLRQSSNADKRRKTTAWYAGRGLKLYELYGSCKAAVSACSVANSTIWLPRSANRRPDKDDI